MTAIKRVGTCHRCGTTDQSKIVYSGTDAFMLGIDGAETGTTCYTCANELNKLKTEEATKVSHVGKCQDCGTTDNAKIVYSEEDAFILGLSETGRICYTCAYTLRSI